MRMILTILAFCITTLAFAENVDLSKMTQPTHPENIHILLEKGVSEALLEVRGPYVVFNPQDGERLSSGILSKRFLVYAKDSGIQWGEQFVGYHQIYISPSKEETSILVNGKQYSGGIAIFQIGNKISIINDLPVETYLKSTLAHHFSYPLEEEVMASIAILSRTNAYYQIQKNYHSFWHVDAKEVGYQGSVLAVPSSSIDHAVDTTRDLILTQKYDDKRFAFAAEWTEHSAGKVAPYHTIYRVDALAPKVPIETPHAALDRMETEWSYAIGKASLAEALNVDRIDSIELFRNQSSKKAYAVRVHMGESQHDIDFFEFQEKLGKRNILSNDLTVQFKNNQFQFTGYGRGYGVGLCLYTASSMAQNGDNAVQILTKFYPGTYMVNLSSPMKKQIVSVLKESPRN